MEENITITPDSAIFQSSDRYLELKILEENVVEMTDVIKPGRYNTIFKYQITFDKKNSVIRASETYLKGSDDCLPYPEDWKTGKYNE